MVGRDKHGPTASLRSVSKLDNVLDSNGSLLNVKLSPLHAGRRGRRHPEAHGLPAQLLSLGRAAHPVQRVDKATLVDAQVHPENHRDLVVRVAGYSAMFVELSRPIQDDIINRTEHVL